MGLGLNNDSNSILGKSNLCCTKLLTGILYPKMNLPKTQFTLITCYLFEVASKLGLVRSDHRLLAVDIHVTWTKEGWNQCDFLKPQSKRPHFLHSGNMRPVNVHGDFFSSSEQVPTERKMLVMAWSHTHYTRINSMCEPNYTHLYKGVTSTWFSKGPAGWVLSGDMELKWHLAHQNPNLENELRTDWQSV